MNVHLLNYEPDRVGGGWSAARNLYTKFNSTYEDAEAVLITGPTMASHDQVEKAKSDGKKIVLRADNAVRDSRNRGTGMSRLKAFCDLADLVIYQSNWAREFLYPWTQKDGAVVLNGVDTDKYNPEGTEEEKYLYVRSSRDEGKMWIAAWYYMVHREEPLEIVGPFSDENLEWKFDFHYKPNRIFYSGQHKDMAPVYKRNKYFLYTYLNDACSNTLLEARASGMEIVDVYGMLSTGGAPEIMACEDISMGRMLREYQEAINVL